MHTPLPPRDDTAPRRVSKRQVMFAILSDHHQHDTGELLRATGHRFGDFIHQLRKRGHLIDTFGDEDRGFTYRLRRPGEDAPPDALYVRSVMDEATRARNLAITESVDPRPPAPEQRGLFEPHVHSTDPRCRCTSIRRDPNPRCVVHWRAGRAVDWPPRCVECGAPVPWAGGLL